MFKKPRLTGTVAQELTQQSKIHEQSIHSTATKTIIETSREYFSISIYSRKHLLMFWFCTNYAPTNFSHEFTFSTNSPMLSWPTKANTFCVIRASSQTQSNCREGRRSIDVNHTSQLEAFIYFSNSGSGSGSGFRIPDSGFRIPDSGFPGFPYALNELLEFGPGDASNSDANNSKDSKSEEEDELPEGARVNRYGRKVGNWRLRYSG